MNEVIKAIKSRRSVRAYKSELLKKRKRSTPSLRQASMPHRPTTSNPGTSRCYPEERLWCVNKKCMELFAASSEPWMQGIAADPNRDVTYRAPVLIILSAKKESNTGKADCLAALENMLLAAKSGRRFLLDGALSFLYSDAGAMRLFGVPDGYVPQESAVFGYVNGAKPAAPPRNMDVVNYVGEIKGE